MLCLFCGLKIDKQVPIIVSSLDLAPPWNFSGTVGKDILTNKYCCHKCYADILKNAAKAAKEVSDALIERGQTEG